MWRCLGGSSSNEELASLVAGVCYTKFRRGLGGGVVEVIVLLYRIMVRYFDYQYPWHNCVEGGMMGDVTYLEFLQDLLLRFHFLLL